MGGKERVIKGEDEGGRERESESKRERIEKTVRVL